MSHTILSQQKFETVGDLIEFLNTIPPEVITHGPFKDKLLVCKIFDKNTGKISLCFED
jgi:hypothetical protein